jgi:hypothetical protein
LYNPAVHFLNFNSFFDQIFLERRPSRCALALDFLVEEYFPQSNLLQRGGERPQEERRGSSCGVQLLFGGGCSGENCSDSIQISTERGASRRAHCLVIAPAIFEIRRAPQEPGFFGSGDILFKQSTTWVFCSAGNPPPRQNPGLKCTRTDDILKKFEFKTNLKGKLNVKWDRTNFRSIQYRGNTIYSLPQSCETVTLM